MSIIAINILTPGDKIIAAYMQSPDDPDVWGWFDENGADTFTSDQQVQLRQIAATGNALAMREDGGVAGKYFRWFDGRTFGDIRVSAFFV